MPLCVPLFVPKHSTNNTHLQALLLDRNEALAAHALTLLTTFVNQSLGGYLPDSLQPHLRGQLIPLNKNNWVQPLVVGELLRALVSKAALKKVNNQLSALQPHQIGVGGKGPVIQAAVLIVKSLVRTMRQGEIILKIDLANAYDTIDRGACMWGISRYYPDLAR